MLNKLLDSYTKLYLEIKNERDRIGLGAKEDKLVELTSQIKEAGRAATNEEVEKVGNKYFYIRRDQPYRKWYNLEAVRKFASRDELTLIEKKAVTSQIDKPKFEELIKAGLVSRELRTKKGVFEEEKQTPRVSIVAVKK